MVVFPGRNSLREWEVDGGSISGCGALVETGGPECPADPSRPSSPAIAASRATASTKPLRLDARRGWLCQVAGGYQLDAVEALAGGPRRCSCRDDWHRDWRLCSFLLVDVNGEAAVVVTKRGGTMLSTAAIGVPRPTREVHEELGIRPDQLDVVGGLVVRVDHDGLCDRYVRRDRVAGCGPAPQPSWITELGVVPLFAARSPRRVSNVDCDH